MRKLIVTYFAIICGSVFGQTNLVINPGFENPSTCSPQATTCNLYLLPDWDCALQTPDYFNSCSTMSSVCVPSNIAGYQMAFSGNGYAGLLTYASFGANLREVIRGVLTQPLVIGQKYFFSFWVSRADSGVFHYNNKIGLRLATNIQNNVNINNWAHIYSNQLISDKINWTKIAGSIIADSAYQYIYFGNFFDDANCTVVQDGNSSFAYYFIDDTRGSTDSSFVYSDQPASISKNVLEKQFVFFPNPADGYLLFDQSINSVRFFNSLGVEIHVETIRNTIDCSLWPNGIYYSEFQNKFHKIIIKH
jgi:hypothetical protein